MAEKTAIFLGAGASAAEGASAQGSLFKDYFTLLQNRVEPRRPHELALVDFFKTMFGIPVVKKNFGNRAFPTFEEVLGILDLADQNNQSFRDLPNLNLQSNSGRINYLRMCLVFLMADILEAKLKKSIGLHRRLVENLSIQGRLNDVFFITTNYDILCDNALLDFCRSNRSKMEYGVDFLNTAEGNNFKQADGSIKLYKIHGSLNWLYCPTCNNLRITPSKKEIASLLRNPREYRCSSCMTQYAPIIVPPTFYKNLSNVFLSQVWNKAEGKLLHAEHIIFCGYSFPDADIHIKYLIKRAQKNRPGGVPFKVSIINNHKGKRLSVKQEEEDRYRRFLGDCVNYTTTSFKQFAENPGKYLDAIK